jgi:hypothetical protein
VRSLRLAPSVGASHTPRSDAKVANRNVGDFGWGIAHAGVSRRLPNPLDTTVARSEGYTYAAQVRDLSIVQGPFSVALCQTLGLRFATFSSLYTTPAAPSDEVACVSIATPVADRSRRDRRPSLRALYGERRYRRPSVVPFTVRAQCREVGATAVHGEPPNATTAPSGAQFRSVLCVLHTLGETPQAPEARGAPDVAAASNESIRPAWNAPRLSDLASAGASPRNFSPMPLHIFLSVGSASNRCSDRAFHASAANPRMATIASPVRSLGQLTRRESGGQGFAVSSAGDRAVATPQAARGWTDPACRHSISNPCCCLGSAFEVANP